MGGFKMFREDVVQYSPAIMWKQNCILCGHVSANTICEECISIAREYYDKLIEYLSKNPKSNVIEVYGNTNIPFKMIKAFLELGWINLVLEDEETRIQTRELILAARS